jgi:hypothetical protein
MSNDNINKVDESQSLDRLGPDGRWVYPSAAQSGHVEIELPALPGSPNATERLHARDFGPFVAGKVESSMKQNPYLKSGPQQSPAATFRHYVAVAKGASLMDSAAIGRMETLAKEFESEAEQREFFEQVLKPYLHSLSPKRR